MPKNTPSNHSAQPDDCRWQSIGALVERLKARVCAAIEAGDEFEAELSHDELTAAEWKMRQRARLMDKAQNRGLK